LSLIGSFNYQIESQLIEFDRFIITQNRPCSSFLSPWNPFF